MSKFLPLQHWLSIPEAAEYLSNRLDERVPEWRLLRLALDGHLTLSVHFVNGQVARVGRLLTQADAGQDERVFQGSEGERRITIPRGIPIRGVNVFVPDTIKEISGLWDLPLVGHERTYVESTLQAWTRGPLVKPQELNGVFVYDERTWCQLMQSADEAAREYGARWMPAIEVPIDSTLVVRPDALAQLIKRLSNETRQRSPAVKDPLRPLGSREWHTLLLIIAALARPAKTPLEEASTSAGLIARMVSALPSGPVVEERHVENCLKAALDLQRAGRPRRPTANDRHVLLLLIAAMVRAANRRLDRATESAGWIARLVSALNTGHDIHERTVENHLRAARRLLTDAAALK